MNSSISSLARFFSSGRRLGEHLAVEDGPGLDGVESQGPAPVAVALEPLGHLVLEPELLLEAPAPREGGGRRRLPVQPGRHRVVGELGPVADQRPVDLRVAHRPVGADGHLDHDRQAIASCRSDVRSVESFSGSMGKISTAV